MPALLRKGIGALVITATLLATACDDHRSIGRVVPVGPDGQDVPDVPLGPDVTGVVVNPLGFGVGAATVEAADGPLAGRSTTTDESGRFLLAGVQLPAASPCV